MGHFQYLKDAKTGRSRLVENNEPETAQVVLAEPATATLEGKKPMKYECTIDGCGKRFRTAGVGAIHFKREHADLRKDKDSWREFVKPVKDGDTS